MADREGKLENRPEKIKHLIFGYDKCKIDVHGELTVLSRLGLVDLYSVSDVTLIIISNFKKHQSPHHTERRSNLADPQQLSSTHGELTVSHGEYPPEPRIMNHEPIYTHHDKDDDGFDAFWKAYPRHTSKSTALKAWNKIRPNNELLAKMLKAINDQKTSDQWIKDGGQFIPHPATWLNQKRWEDEIQKEEVPSWMKIQPSTMKELSPQKN